MDFYSFWAIAILGLGFFDRHQLERQSAIAFRRLTSLAVISADTVPALYTLYIFLTKKKNARSSHRASVAFIFLFLFCAAPFNS
jgi:hypothetical protein